MNEPTGSLQPDSVTRDLAVWIVARDRTNYREETLRRARHAVLDWFAVAIAGSSDPLVDILVSDALADGNHGSATLPGRAEQLSFSAAALINGASSHALDYDDVHARLHGHPSVAVLPAVLAAAEQLDVSGAQLLDAFVVGYEAACALGDMVHPDHYDSGWHATGTIGTFGAAAGTARLLGLNLEQCEHALGLAATQAAGLKAMFGTMAKPLHAARAAHNGLLASRWASRGFTAGHAAIEAHQGFTHTHAGTLKEGRLPASESEVFALESGLFKFHAACYLTHSAIEAVRAIKLEHALSPGDVNRILVRVVPAIRDVCDIERPRSGLEVKFSIRHLTAMAMHEVDTGRLATYAETTANQPDLISLRERVQLIDSNDVPRMGAAVTIDTRDGRTLTADVDAGVPLADTAGQERKLDAKFEQLVSPVLGGDQARSLRASIHELDRLDSLQSLLADSRQLARRAATA